MLKAMSSAFALPSSPFRVNNTLAGYKVSGVTVNNLDALRATKAVSVTTPISAALVTGVSVAING